MPKTPRDDLVRIVGELLGSRSPSWVNWLYLVLLVLGLAWLLLGAPGQAW